MPQETQHSVPQLTHSRSPDLKSLVSFDEKPDEEVDLYAGMSDEVKERVIAIEDKNKDLNHRLNSDAGRVSALQIKINGLEKDIQDVRAGSTTGSQPNTNQIAEAMQVTDEEWEKFSEDYPEVAKDW